MKPTPYPNNINANLRDFLDVISNISYVQTLKYTHTKDKHYSEKYKKGRLEAYRYLQDIVYYFYQEEATLKSKLIKQIQAQIDYIDLLDKTEYNMGVIDALNEMISELLEHNNSELEVCHEIK